MTKTATQSLQTATNQTVDYDIEASVIERYEAGAQKPQASLCCPTSYEASYLDILPQEIIEKDYGCGDPTRYVRVGETVVDLGSGAGKNCYIIAQKVGAAGQVIGVDFNDEMLSLARKYQGEIAQTLGYANTAFVKGKIQDLKLDAAQAEGWLKSHPIETISGLSAFEAECDRLRTSAPLIEDDNVDVVISNCVLNLVRPQDKKQLFGEIFRVLKRGGRAVISDIVCDEDPTPAILNDPELWSGCIAGAFREDEFLEMFEAAGFYGIEILQRQAEPWQVIDGVEFRSLTVQAFKGKEGECWERKQSVIYQGPWKQVQDDDGHVFCRGERMAVCDKTFQIMTNSHGPYAGQIIGLEPYTEIPLTDAELFHCRSKAIRHPRETKGPQGYPGRQQNGHTPAVEDCCTPGECC